MSLALRLSDESMATVGQWQRAAGLHEVCGFCATDPDGAQHLLKLANHAGLPDSFEISRSEDAVARAAAAQKGWTIVAFVHTHPVDGPAMSSRDAVSFELEALPWIIVGRPGGASSQRTYMPDASGGGMSRADAVRDPPHE